MGCLWFATPEKHPSVVQSKTTKVKIHQCISQISRFREALLEFLRDAEYAGSRAAKWAEESGQLAESMSHYSCLLTDLSLRAFKLLSALAIHIELFQSFLALGRASHRATKQLVALKDLVGNGGTVASQVAEIEKLEERKIEAFQILKQKRLPLAIEDYFDASAAFYSGLSAIFLEIATIHFAVDENNLPIAESRHVYLLGKFCESHRKAFSRLLTVHDTEVAYFDSLVHFVSHSTSLQASSPKTVSFVRHAHSTLHRSHVHQTVVDRWGRVINGFDGLRRRQEKSLKQVQLTDELSKTLMTSEVKLNTTIASQGDGIKLTKWFQRQQRTFIRKKLASARELYRLKSMTLDHQVVLKEVLEQWKSEFSNAGEDCQLWSQCLLRIRNHGRESQFISASAPVLDCPETKRDSPKRLATAGFSHLSAQPIPDPTSASAPVIYYVGTFPAPNTNNSVTALTQSQATTLVNTSTTIGSQTLTGKSLSVGLHPPLYETLLENKRLPPVFEKKAFLIGSLNRSAPGRHQLRRIVPEGTVL